jgi:hypothetical protein
VIYTALRKSRTIELDTFQVTKSILRRLDTHSPIPDTICQHRGAALPASRVSSSVCKTMRIDKVEPILKEACSQVYPESAICVQRLDDSLNSAIRITYRISLRSSSLREPRYPLLRVVYHYDQIALLHRLRCGTAVGHEHSHVDHVDMKRTAAGLMTNSFSSYPIAVPH